MARTLRLADDETDALRRRADLEGRSMQQVAPQAVREYVETHSRAELLNQVDATPEDALRLVAGTQLSQQSAAGTPAAPHR